MKSVLISAYVKLHLFLCFIVATESSFCQQPFWLPQVLVY